MDENASPNIPQVPALTGNQSRLAQVLADRDSRYGFRLADMYVGALVALQQQQAHADYLAHAAHGMRELLDKLPQSHDGAPVRVEVGRVSQDMYEISTEFMRARAESACAREGAPRWAGEIDDHLLRLLVHVEAAANAKLNAPNRRDEQREFLRRLDPATNANPVPGEDEQLKAWKRFTKYFSDVAHHRGKAADDADVRRRMDECTAMLLAQLRPETSAIFDQLDAIIAEEE